MHPKPGDIFRCKEATSYLWSAYCIKLKAKSLANLSSKGGGPAYFKDRRTGVVYYSKTELDRWIRDNFETFTSTSEQQAKCAVGVA